MPQIECVDPYLYLEHTCKQSPTEHIFEWIIDKEATKDETGIKHEQCILCGYAKNAVLIEKLVDEHSKPSGIEINGYQLSTSVGGQQGVGGMRVVYSVNDTIDGKKVVGSGLIYAIDEVAQKNQMFIGSTDYYVHSFESTTQGKLLVTASNSSGATSYAMTMKFVNQSALEYTYTYDFRAYAELEDGTYVYSNICRYRVYDVAEQVYTTGGMPTEAGHNYLYENILRRVNNEYAKIDYIAH